ncbi:MAG: hypothetical protein ABI835_17525 [Chloroflexota bacterium]
MQTTSNRIRSGAPTFYTLAAAQTFSQIGSTMSFLAVGIYVYKQTGEATPLALLSMFMILPYLIVSGFAGVLALIAALVTFALPSVRTMEATLPSYQSGADAATTP